MEKSDIIIYTREAQGINGFERNRRRKKNSL